MAGVTIAGSPATVEVCTLPDSLGASAPEHGFHCAWLVGTGLLFLDVPSPPRQDLRRRESAEERRFKHLVRHVAVQLQGNTDVVME